MGLISKIEDKLSSNKESDSSKLQKSGYEDQSSNSHLRHPVGSGTTSGTYGSSTTGTTGSSGLTGSHGPSGAEVGRDGYGHSSSGHDSRMDPRDATSAGGIGSGHSSGGYGSSTGRTDPRDAVSSGGVGSGPREPYDPYSSKGQSTAANAATGYPGETSRGDYGSSNTYANDPNVPRSREGGIMNAGSHPSAHNTNAIPTAGGQRVGSTNVNDPYSSSDQHMTSGHQDPYSSSGHHTSSGHQDPYSTSTQNSSGHPIRDAAMMGGAGAAGTGMGHHSSSHNPQDVSYMNRSGGAGEMQPGIGQGMASGMGSGMSPATQTGGMTGSGSSAPPIDPKKMGGAYEAGYRDAMEHAKEQMGLNK